MMNNNCDKIKDQVTDMIDGLLSEAEVEAVQQHLDCCPDCRDYAQALEKEDHLLTELFDKFRANATSYQDEVIEAMDYLGESGQSNIISIGRRVVESSVTGLAAAVAIIVFMALYLIVTLTWISEINECIRYCS